MFMNYAYPAAAARVSRAYQRAYRYGAGQTLTAGYAGIELCEQGYGPALAVMYDCMTAEGVF